jgi:hypothetical protein
MLSRSLAASISSSLTIPNDYVLVPGGYMHKSCVYQIDDTTTLSLDKLSPCNYPSMLSSRTLNTTHGSAWKAWSQFAPGGSVTSLSSDWIVPGEPSNSEGQTLFFWNGIEPEDTSAVLQPVLQWGSSAAGGGNYWAYSSWYVSSTHGSHFSPLIAVQQGDVITGSNILDSKSGLWNISCTAPGRKSSVLSFKPVPGAWPTAYHVLEAYEVTNVCSLYPSAGSVNFTNIKVSFDNAPVDPIKWQFDTQTAGCGEYATADTTGDEVSIHFKTN